MILLFVMECKNKPQFFSCDSDLRGFIMKKKVLLVIYHLPQTKKYSEASWEKELRVIITTSVWNSEGQNRYCKRIWPILATVPFNYRPYKYNQPELAKAMFLQSKPSILHFAFSSYFNLLYLFSAQISPFPFELSHQLDNFKGRRKMTAYSLFSHTEKKKKWTVKKRRKQLMHPCLIKRQPQHLQR